MIRSLLILLAVLTGLLSQPLLPYAAPPQGPAVAECGGPACGDLADSLAHAEEGEVDPPQTAGETGPYLPPADAGFAPPPRQSDAAGYGGRLSPLASPPLPPPPRA